VNLKSRIEDLKKATGSLTIKELCEKANAKLTELNEMRITRVAREELENHLIEELINDFKNENDEASKKFVIREERFFVIRNLGVKKAISAIKESDISSHPALSYAIAQFEKLSNQPEFLIAENFYARLNAFNWHPIVKESLETIKDNAIKYKEDIIIQKSVHEIKNSRSSYILTGLRETLDDYILNRTKSAKARLVEKLNKFTFDPLVRNLANAVRESNDNSLDVKTSKAGTEVERIFSPVIITENSEIFAIGTDIYEKKGTELSKLDEATIKQLDPEFLTMVNFIANQSVKISEGIVTVYAKNKKVEITNESISVNGKAVTREDFAKIYMNAGVFNRSELGTMSAIDKIAENFNTIVEIDFAKRFRTPLVGNRRIDVIKLEENIFVTKEDPQMGRLDFFKNLNATQTRSIVLEFMNYDIYEAFGTMIAEDEAKLNAIEESKKTYIKTITQLEEKLSELNTITDTYVIESKEFKAIVKSLEDEIAGLKEEYSEFVAQAHTIKNVPEVNEESVESEVKPTIEFKADMRVHCKKLKCDGTVTAVNDVTGMVSILCDDGKTCDCEPENLEILPAEVTGVKEGEIEIKVDGKKVEISTGDDDESDEESEEKEAKSNDDEESDDKADITEESVKAEETEETETEEEESDEVNEGVSSEVKDMMKALKDGKTVYGENIRFPGRFKVTGFNNSGSMATVDYEDGTKPFEMAAMNIAIDKIQILESETETVEESETDEVSAVAEKLAKMNKANEDHAKSEEPAESTAEFKANDRVEDKSERYGTVQGVSDTTGKVTVVFDDGETCECEPSELVIVEETGVDESAGAGDEIELEDGKRGMVQGQDDNTGQLTVLTDDGETLTVDAKKVKVISDKSAQEDIEEGVEGQQTDGDSVDIKE